MDKKITRGINCNCPKGKTKKEIEAKEKEIKSFCKELNKKYV